MFKKIQNFAYARAADVMSTQSANGFEWSVKFVGHSYFMAGITSRLEPGYFLYNVDQNSILYDSNEKSPIIRIGSSKSLTSPKLTQQKSGDVIHFKFQPQTRKLVIELVRVFFYASTKNICDVFFL